MSSAIPDEDLPGGGGGGTHCVAGETHGFYQVLFECRSGNGLYWRLICDDITVDINPDRVLIQHGANVSAEVRSDKIITRAPVLEHYGNMVVDGTIRATGDVIADHDATHISLQHHHHQFGYMYDGSVVNSETGEPSPS